MCNEIHWMNRSKMVSTVHSDKWKMRSCSRELYLDVSCKDASVLPELSVPNCDCGKPARVAHSMHPNTVAHGYYRCHDYRVCNIF